VSDLVPLAAWLGVVLLLVLLLDVLQKWVVIPWRRWTLRRRSASRSAFLALSPVQIVERFDLEQLDKTGALLWMSTMSLDMEKRRMIYGLLGRRWGLEVDPKDVEFEALAPETSSEGRSRSMDARAPRSHERAS
jgi:hypothetical protein